MALTAFPISFVRILPPGKDSESPGSLDHIIVFLGLWFHDKEKERIVNSNQWIRRYENVWLPLG